MSARAWEAVGERLDRLAQRNGPSLFWLRDDDASAPVCALDRLLGIAEARRVPVHLAVIPALAGPALAAHLRARHGVFVLQHGFSHADHAPEGVKKTELGDHRPLAAILAELKDGQARLDGFSNRLPILVPPWNRIGHDVAAHLPELGYRGLSLFGTRRRNPPAAGLLHLNTHVDPVDWRGGRRFAGAEAVLGALSRRLDGLLDETADETEPTGLLTHHRVHDEETFIFLTKLLDYLARREDCRFLSAGDILANR